MSQAITATRLALKDMLHEWRLTLCLVSALAAILTPLLMLYGLKMGVVDLWRARLISNPANLQIQFLENVALDDNWFTEMRKRPDVSFVVPQGYAVKINGSLRGKDRKYISNIGLIITAKGDPLVPAALPLLNSAQDILLTEKSAQRLQLLTGDPLTLSFTRHYQGKRQNVKFTAILRGIIPSSHYSKENIFVHSDLFRAAESYKRGKITPTFNITEGSDDIPAFPPYPRARLYAKNLYDVMGLSDYISSQNIQVKPRGAEIASLQSVDQTLTSLFLLIAILGSVGFVISLSASLWANIVRKKREMALLKLMGMRPFNLALFPIIQALMIAFCGLILSYFCYYLIGFWLNEVLSEHLKGGEQAVMIPPTHILISAGMILCAALLASTIGAITTATLNPAEGLNETAT